jgi:hypothetical protein
MRLPASFTPVGGRISGNCADLSTAAVDLSPMSDSDNNYDDPFVLNPAKNPYVAHAIAPERHLRTRQQFAQSAWIAGALDIEIEEFKNALPIDQAQLV